MRQITRDSIRAFRNGTKFKRGNTEVRTVWLTALRTFEAVQLCLHGNIIAERTQRGLEISTCGWNTPTTRERLNGLPGVHVVQRKGQLYLNGEAWNGQRIKIYC
jgi:hypothetical protein